MPPASAWSNITMGTIALAIICGLIYLAAKSLDRKPNGNGNGYEARIQVLEKDLIRVNEEIRKLREWRHDLGNKVMLAIIAIHERGERH